MGSGLALRHLRQAALREHVPECMPKREIDAARLEKLNPAAPQRHIPRPAMLGDAAFSELDPAAGPGHTPQLGDGIAAARPEDGRDV